MRLKMQRLAQNSNSDNRSRRPSGRLPFTLPDASARPPRSAAAGDRSPAGAVDESLVSRRPADVYRRKRILSAE
jgi:hypothetical protein